LIWVSGFSTTLYSVNTYYNYLNKKKDKTGRGQKKNICDTNPVGGGGKKGK
jgi:hypothetical protein